MTNLINTALDLYQVVLQSGADKREYNNVDNNILLKAIGINNELLHAIINTLTSKTKNLRKEREIMCNTLIQKANEDQVKKFAIEAMNKIKNNDKELYDELMMSLYEDMYGCHFNEWMLNKALEGMINEDGTNGEHWSMEQTNSVARQYGVEFKHFNEYDWNYTMNMIYSDYYGVLTNETSTYVKMARRFLEDKDAPVGKALYYYWAMSK